MKKTLGTLMVAASAIAFSASANAMEYTPYVGLDYVNSNLSNNDADGLHNHFDSVSVNVGANYNEYFGTELFYTKSDNDKHHFNTTGEDLKSKYNAYGLDLMGYLPMGCDQTFALVGTVGIGEYTFTHKAEGDVSHDDSGIGYRVGAGAQYSIDENWAVRALARYATFEKTEAANHMIDYTAGVRYNF